MRRVVDFVTLNRFKYRVEKNQSTVFFEISPNLELSIVSPENGPYKLFFSRVVLKRYILENHLIFESKKQDEVFQLVIKFLKYPIHLKIELKSRFDAFRKMESPGS